MKDGLSDGWGVVGGELGGVRVCVSEGLGDRRRNVLDNPISPAINRAPDRGHLGRQNTRGHNESRPYMWSAWEGMPNGSGCRDA